MIGGVRPSIISSVCRVPLAVPIGLDVREWRGIPVKQRDNESEAILLNK